MSGHLRFLMLLNGFAFLGAELGSESEDGFAAPLVLGGDVHNKSGASLSEGDRVEDLEGTEGFAFDGQLLQSRQEAPLIAEG